MARGIAASTDELTAPGERKPGFSFENLREGEIEVQDLSNGLVTGVPRDKLPRGSFSGLVNARLRRTHIVRRGGFQKYIVEPNTNDVLKLVTARISDDVDWIIRVTPGSIHATPTESGWFALSTSGTQYVQFLRMTAAQFLDDIYIANLEKKIVRIRLSNLTFDEIDQAPHCKFITTFAERIVAGYVISGGAVETTQIKWSANANPLVWDPLEDISAGEENLINSPSDTGDEISGIFAFGQNLAVILRERSIWHITRQPYAAAPFRFIPVVTDIGCDMPYTAVRTPSGIMFCDQRTNAVWLYAPGSPPQRVSAAIERDADGDDLLLKDLNLKEQSEAIFEPKYKEYVLAYNSDETYTNRLDNVRVFNFDTSAWTTDEDLEATTLAVSSKVGIPTMIDDLVGFIDDLQGTIYELSSQGNKPSILLKGDEVGRVMDQSPDHHADKDLVGVDQYYNIQIESQQFVGTSKRRKLKQFLAVIEADNDVGAAILLSKNGGAFVQVKSYSDLTSHTKIGIKNTHRVGDRLKWKITSNAQNFKFFEWSMKLLEKGPKEIEEE